MEWGITVRPDMSAEHKLAGFTPFDAVAAKDSDLDNGMPWPREGGHSFAQGQGKINDAAGLRKICGGTHRTTVKVPGLTDDNSASTLGINGRVSVKRLLGASSTMTAI